MTHFLQCSRTHLRVNFLLSSVLNLQSDRMERSRSVSQSCLNTLLPTDSWTKNATTVTGLFGGKPRVGSYFLT